MAQQQKIGMNKDDVYNLRAQFQVKSGYNYQQAREKTNALQERIDIFCNPDRTWFSNKTADRNPRNFQPRNRLQVSYMLGWTLLHTFRNGEEYPGGPRKIYGGFIRDYICRNRAPNDIDLQLMPSDFTGGREQNQTDWWRDLNTALHRDWSQAGQERSFCPNVRLLMGCPSACGSCQPPFYWPENRYTYSSNSCINTFFATKEGQDMTLDPRYRQSQDSLDDRLKYGQQVDGVKASCFAPQSMGVPADVDNLCITREGIDLKKKLDTTTLQENEANPFSSLPEALYNCMTNKAVFYLNPLTDERGMQLRENQKCVRAGNSERGMRLISRGFQLLNWRLIQGRCDNGIVIEPVRWQQIGNINIWDYVQPRRTGVPGVVPQPDANYCTFHPPNFGRRMANNDPYIQRHLYRRSDVRDQMERNARDYGPRRNPNPGGIRPPNPRRNPNPGGIRPPNPRQFGRVIPRNHLEPRRRIVNPNPNPNPAPAPRPPRRQQIQPLRNPNAPGWGEIGRNGIRVVNNAVGVVAGGIRNAAPGQFVDRHGELIGAVSKSIVVYLMVQGALRVVGLGGSKKIVKKKKTRRKKSNKKTKKRRKSKRKMKRKSKRKMKRKSKRKTK